MITESTLGDSELALMDQLNKLADAGASVIQLRTREPLRASMVLRKHLIVGDAPYKEWDVVNGFRVFTKENFTEHRIQGDRKQFVEALEVPLADLRNPSSQLSSETNKIHYYVYVDPHPYIKDNPYAVELITQYAAILPSTNACTVFITDDATLPNVPLGTVLTTELNTPSIKELEDLIERVAQSAIDDQRSFPGGSELTEEDLRQIAHLGLGLSLYEFETYMSIAIIDGTRANENTLTAARIVKGISEAKTAVVKQSDILELIHPVPIDEVGGMNRLKDWLSVRANSFSEGAIAYGVEPPKGIVLVGTPGVGKSLVAKAVSSVFGVPIIRLDFGRVFSKYVGDSESRVRSALKMVEQMAPCVLFADEIDKGLGGAGGGGDSGASSRVLGSYLTWLQECTAPVFSVVTANRVQGLPPELFRRGRFDRIFSVTMPDERTRKEVLAIHLKKRGRDIGIFNKADIASFLQASQGYVPAEIEAAVKDAITDSYADPEATDLEMRHILHALKEMIPLSKSHKAAIEQITQWAEANATPVEYTNALPNPDSDVAPSNKPVGRVIRTRR